MLLDDLEAGVAVASTANVFPGPLSLLLSELCRLPLRVTFAFFAEGSDGAIDVDVGTLDFGSDDTGIPSGVSVLTRLSA